VSMINQGNFVCFIVSKSNQCIVNLIIDYPIEICI
jgi:hypothetical protein